MHEPDVVAVAAKMTLLGDRILIRRVAPPKMTPGGLHIPDAYQVKEGTWDDRVQFEAVVLATGPGKFITKGPREGEPRGMTLKSGDRILCGKYGAEKANKSKTLSDLGDDVFIMNEEDVMVVLSSEKERSSQ